MDEQSRSTPHASGSNDELLVWLVTRDGALRFERSGAESGSGVAETGSDFVWSPRHGDRVSLRLRDTASYLSVPDTGQLTLSDAEAGSEPAFDIVEAEGMPRLRLAGTDRLLSVRLDRSAGADAPLFIDFRGLANDPQASLLGCCCGRRSSSTAGVLWDDHTHNSILETAVEKILGPLQGQAQLVKLLYQVWQNTREFPWELVVRLAMREADYSLPWAREQRLGFFFYNDHFFDPGTGRNYEGEESSAVTVGAATFGESVRAWKDRQYLVAAKRLGISLHFLSDLTQPMHAANFTNLSKPYLAHAGFEKYAEDKVLRGRFFDNYPAGTIRDLDITHHSATDFLKDVARTSKGIFVSSMKDFLERNQGLVNPTWPPEVADRCLRSSLWLAPRVVARYLVLWGAAAELGSNPGVGIES